MAIDRIDWHWDSIANETPEDEHWERAGAHIGYFIEWAYKKGLAPNNPETHDVDEYLKVVNSEVSGIQFLIENCDTKFWDEDLSEQGQKFATFAYEVYIGDLEGILKNKPYADRYNQQDLQRVSEYLDKLYARFMANLPAKAAENEKLSLAQKIKRFFR